MAAISSYASIDDGPYGSRSTEHEGLNFSNVRVVIGEPNRQIGEGIQGGLRDLGFRYITLAEKMSKVREAVSRGDVDLLICATEFADGSLCDLANAIRRNMIGRNPFIVVIALVKEATRSSILSVVNSGCDDVIPKPVTNKAMTERIMKLTRERKEFVVTADYVGPSRRGIERSDAQMRSTMTVPNPLHAKTCGTNSKELYQRDVSKAAKLIGQQYEAAAQPARQQPLKATAG